MVYWNSSKLNTHSVSVPANNQPIFQCTVQNGFESPIYVSFLIENGITSPKYIIKCFNISSGKSLQGTSMSFNGKTPLF